MKKTLTIAIGLLGFFQIASASTDLSYIPSLPYTPNATSYNSFVKILTCSGTCYRVFFYNNGATQNDDLGGSYTAVGTGNLVMYPFNGTYVMAISAQDGGASFPTDGTRYDCTDGTFSNCTESGTHNTDILLNENTGSYLITSSRDVQSNTGSVIFPKNYPDLSFSRFIDPYTPTNGSYASTTLTTFSANYNFNCERNFGIYDLVGIEIKDLTDTTKTPSTAPKTINACGIGNYTQNISLITTHQYLWRPIIYSSAGTSSPLTGYWYSFLATSTPNFTPFTQFTGSTVGTSTLVDTTNLLSFLNVPNLLQTKVPFGYFFEAKDAIIQGINSSSTTEIPSGSIDVSFNGGTATSTFDLFSTSTIGYFITPTFQSLFRGLLLAGLYIEFLYLLYHRGKSQKII